jgi:putative component of membrane protein insertase Oxa1/YidC/SpoIIIJ protein YidD
MDRLFCWAAILAIRLYQVCGRGFVRRECLFAPTCSHRAIAFFRAGSFLGAWRATRGQLARCTGNYSLRLNRHREVEMVTAAGEVIPERELSERIVRKLKRFAQSVHLADAERP